MPGKEYDFDVRFNCKNSNVTINFTKEQHAEAYARIHEKCTRDAKIVTLQPLDGLEIIRVSDSSHDMMFVFDSVAAGKKWKSDCVLASGTGRVVRIKRTRDSDELDSMLRLASVGEGDARQGLTKMGGVTRMGGGGIFRAKTNERENQFKLPLDNYRTKGSGRGEDLITNRTRGE